MKEVLKFVVIVAVLVKASLMVIGGGIKLPKFISNTIGLHRMTDRNTIYIQGLGHFNYSSILEAKKNVEETYGVASKIIKQIFLTSQYYYNGMINAAKCIDYDKNKVLITKETCFHFTKDAEVFQIGGLDEISGNIVIVINKSSFSKNNLKQCLIH